jgi:Tfp pilus assembly protein PilX
MRRLLDKFHSNQRGSILLVFIITMPFLILLAMYYMKLSLTSFQVARFDQLHTEAQMAADAGADYATEQLNLNNAWTGTTSDVTLQNSNNIKTTFTASVTGNASAKTIAVTGKTYWPAYSTTPNRTVSIYVSLYPVVSGNYSIVAGAGGLVVANSAKVVGGSVLINGTITMSNSAQIGLSTAPVNVQVADDVCPNPANATYPRVCNSGENGQPISISGLAHIYGTVNATNQTTGSGMSNSGLVAGGSANPQTLPTYNRAAQEAAAAANRPLPGRRIPKLPVM